MSQAIEARSVDHEKSAHVNRLTLHFRDRDVERNYHKDIDLGFSIELLCSLLLLILSTALQVSIFPRTYILLLLFLTAFIWIASILMLMLAARLKWILWDLSHSFILRIAIIVFTIILLYSLAQVNVVSLSKSEEKQKHIISTLQYRIIRTFTESCSKTKNILHRECSLNRCYFYFIILIIQIVHMLDEPTMH